MQLFSFRSEDAQQRQFEALMSIALLEWEIPLPVRHSAALSVAHPSSSVISGHDADLQAGNTLSAHSCMELKGERKREREQESVQGKYAKMMTEFEKKGEVAAPL